MSLSCLGESQVQNECAVRFSLVSKPVPVLEYIKATASLVGASHILAVFEENECLKIFFDDKRYVETVIRSGIHVMSNHVRIDYVVPPGIKVILSNVDPIIPNYDVLKLLSTYGSVVSPIFRPPISDNTELCHIGYGVRYVYMLLNDDIPNKIELKYCDQFCSIRVTVEDKQSMLPLPFIKSDESENFDEMNALEFTFNALPLADMNNSDPVVTDVDSVPQHNESIATLKCDLSPTRSRKRKGRPTKVFTCKKVTSTSRAAKRIKNNVKKTRSNYMSINIRKITKGKKKQKSIPKLVPEVAPFESSASAPSEPFCSENDNEVPDSLTRVSQLHILEPQKLLMYIEEVKRHRAPIELARKYIGDSCDTSMIFGLIDQLFDYNASHNDLNLKARILRLIKVLKETV